MALLDLKDQILVRAEQQIESHLAASQKDAFFRIISAGLKIGLDKGANGLLASLTKSQDPVSDLVRGTVGVLGICRRSSAGTMPAGVMAQAGMALVLRGLQFLEQSRIIPQVTPEVLDQATHQYIETVMSALKITPQKMNQMMTQTSALTTDPAKLAQLKAAGVANGPTQ